MRGVAMLLDCTDCPGRGTACDGCVVAAVLDPTPGLPREVAAAIGVLRDAGLIGPVHLALQPTAAPQRTPVPLTLVHRRVG